MEENNFSNIHEEPFESCSDENEITDVSNEESVNDGFDNSESSDYEENDATFVVYQDENDYDNLDDNGSNDSEVCLIN